MCSYKSKEDAWCLYSVAVVVCYCSSHLACLGLVFTRTVMDIETLTMHLTRAIDGTAVYSVYLRTGTERGNPTV